MPSYTPIYKSWFTHCPEGATLLPFDSAPWLKLTEKGGGLEIRSLRMEVTLDIEIISFTEPG